jgi:excisionase family DNA binding protein
MSELMDKEIKSGKRAVQTERYRHAMDAAVARLARARAERLAYSIDELAVLAGCGRDKIYQAVRDKKLRARKLGRRTLIIVGDAQEFLNELPDLELPE